MKKIYLIIALVFTVGLGVGFSVNVSGEEALIPSWIKNTAGFWVDDKIGDKEFIQALQWLIDNDVLQVTQKDPELEKLEQELQKRILEDMLNQDQEEELVVGMGFECDQEWIGDTLYWIVKIEIMNHDTIPHTVVMEIQDTDQFDRVIVSKEDTFPDLQPKERVTLSGQIERTEVGGFCNAIIKEIK